MVETGQEKDWVEQSRQGDHAAFKNLIRRYQRMIHSLTYRMTGSQADAEDAAQETFIRAFRQLATYRGESDFPPGCAGPSKRRPEWSFRAETERSLILISTPSSGGSSDRIFAALSLYLKAASGNSTALMQLGDMCLAGRDIPKSRTKA
jgi:hypothetical protein